MSIKNTLEGYHNILSRSSSKNYMAGKNQNFYLLGAIGDVIKRYWVALIFDHLPTF